MAKLTKTDAVWNTIDTETLPSAIGDAYRSYKDAYKDMKEARLAFETIIAKAIDPAKGKRVIFGYNFGKLSVAVVDADPAKSKPASSAIALSALAMR